MKKINLIGSILIILGLFFYLKDIVEDRYDLYKEDKRINNTIKDIVSYQYSDNNYSAILVIPKINLRKGIYEIGDDRNNVDSNIMIDKNSIYPNKDKSNIILVAHSGIGKIAYFSRLEELDNDSLIEFYYEHTKYVYKIDH